MMRFGVGLPVVVAAGFLALACGSSSGSGGCTGDSQCGTGKVCAAEGCVVKPCNGPADCFENQTCVEVLAGQGKVCTGVECGIGTGDPDCALKAAADGRQYRCELGACVAKEVPAEDVLQPDAKSQETLEAVEEAAAEAAVEAAAEATPEMVGGDGRLCSSCSRDEDCAGTGSMCTPLPEGDFCTTLCNDNDGCPSGFLCLQITSQARQCVPGSYNKCAACLATPCQDGQYCDQVGGQCKPVTGQCQTCVKDDECGLGARCMTFAAGARKCVPECGEGDACPAKSSCEKLSGQQGTADVKACVPEGSECCFGDACTACNCTDNPGLPHCNPLGNCVACTADEHCAQGQTCQGYQCQVTQCSDPAKPILWGGQCVQCTDQTHCAGTPQTPSCDLGSHTCGPSSACLCAAPYPVCLVVNGQVSCVECSADTDCDAGCACDSLQHVCLAADGTSFCKVGGCAEANQDCAQNGCPLDPTSGAQLQCDAPSGCCFSPAGGCDNVTSFCVSQGAECRDLLSLFGMGGLAGGIPGAGEMLMGFCNCTDVLANPLCLLGLDPSCVQCPQGMLCMDPLSLLTALGGSGTTPPPTGEASGVCVDLTALLSGLGL
jgi:hypothetical protein